MPVIEIPARWLESARPGHGGKEIIFRMAMTPDQIQATLNDMASIISEQAWREMVEKTFEETVQPRRNQTQGEGK